MKTIDEFLDTYGAWQKMERKGKSKKQKDDEDDEDEDEDEDDEYEDEYSHKRYRHEVETCIFAHRKRRRKFPPKTCMASDVIHQPRGSSMHSVS